MTMNRELGFDEMSEWLFEMEYGRIPLKVPQTMSWVVFGLFERILLFLRNLTFCYEDESGTRINGNVRMPIEMEY